MDFNGASIGNADLESHGLWIDLDIPAADFRAAASLETGQCFHWKRIKKDEWLGLVKQELHKIAEHARHDACAGFVWESRFDGPQDLSEHE